MKRYLLTDKTIHMIGVSLESEISRAKSILQDLKAGDTPLSNERKKKNFDFWEKELSDLQEALKEFRDYKSST